MKNYPTYKQSAILMVYWFLWIIPVAVPIYFLTDIKSGIGLLFLYTISLGLTCVTGFRLRNNWSLPRSRFSWQVIAISLVMILAAEFVLEPLVMLADSGMLMQLFNGVKREPVPYFLMVAIAAPILEEVLFRGIILDGFLKNYKPAHAILASAFLFAVIHGNIAQGISALIIGIVFGWIYLKTQSIVPSILLHALGNAISFFSVLSTDSANLQKSTREWFGNDLLYFSFYIFSAALAGVCAWYLHRKYFERQAIGQSQ